MSQVLQNVKITFDRKVVLEEILNTPDDSDFDYFIKLDLSYPYNKREKTKNLHFDPEKKIINPDDLTSYMEKIKPKNYIKTQNNILGLD